MSVSDYAVELVVLIGWVLGLYGVALGANYVTQYLVGLLIRKFLNKITNEVVSDKPQEAHPLPDAHDFHIRNEDKLLKGLEDLFNRLSVDNDLNIPDFMLAEHVVSHLLDIKLLYLQLNTWKHKPLTEVDLEGK